MHIYFDDEKQSERIKGRSIRKKLKNYTVIDIETTGTNVKTCEIIELAAVKIWNGRIVDKYNTLVKPVHKVPKEVEQLTGITNEMLENAPDISEVIEEYIEFIDDDVVLGHNITQFDTNIIYDNYLRCCNEHFENDMLDTYHYARCCDIDVPDYKLTTVAEYFGIDTLGAHRALEDCIIDHQCYESLKPLYTGKYKASPVSDTPKKSHKQLHYSETTQSLQMLQGLIKGILCDNILSDDEIRFLNNWINENNSLSGNYPFDVIFQKLNDVLEDNVITEDERTELINTLEKAVNPVENSAESVTEDFDLIDKAVCLTGEFESFSKSELINKLENIGVIVKKDVSSKVNYLIVGNIGNENWSCGNYGNKVKKALEYQKKGKDIKIIKEGELMKWLAVKI